MKDQEYCTLSKVPLSELHIGQIIFDDDGQLYVIVSIELALPRNDFTSIHRCRYNTLTAINVNGKKISINTWQRWTGTTDFDNYHLLGISLNMISIKPIFREEYRNSILFNRLPSLFFVSRETNHDSNYQFTKYYD